MSVNTLYSSFTDPHLKHYYADERRLKQLRTFGLLNRNYEVYPERVYQKKVIQADRRDALVQLIFQKEAREALHEQHLKLHRRWDKKEKEPNHERVASAKPQASKPIHPNLHLPDFRKWTRKDFIQHGFEYYPDYCRPQTSPAVQWRKSRETHSATRPSTSDDSPYLNVLPKFQRQSTEKHEKEPSSNKEPKQEQSNVVNKDDSVDVVVKSPTTLSDKLKQTEPASKDSLSEHNVPIKQRPVTPISLTTKFNALTRSPSLPSFYLRKGVSSHIMRTFRSPKPLDLLDNDF